MINSWIWRKERKERNLLINYLPWKKSLPYPNFSRWESDQLSRESSRDSRTIHLYPGEVAGNNGSYYYDFNGPPMRIWIVKRGSVSVTPICTRWLILRYSCGPACRDIVLAIVEPGRCSRKKRKRKKIYIKNTKNFECFPSPSRIEK